MTCLDISTPVSTVLARSCRHLPARLFEVGGRNVGHHGEGEHRGIAGRWDSPIGAFMRESSAGRSDPDRCSCNRAPQAQNLTGCCCRPRSGMSALQLDPPALLWRGWRPRTRICAWPSRALRRDIDPYGSSWLISLGRFLRARRGNR